MIFHFLVFLFSNSSISQEIVDYSGNKIIFKIDSSLVSIYKDAEASYGDLHVWAETLNYYLKDKFLDARGEVRFTDGNNDIQAHRMTYDVDKEIGIAFKAKTEVERGWFYGEEVKYIEGRVLKIRNGFYTTCEFDPPHYWFYSPNMRVNIDKDIVAEPVVLLLRGIPLFFIPFYFHPMKKERCSGIITPSFGSSSYEGKYIEDIGWYQTLGPHADATISMDYYTKAGIKGRLSARWKLFPYGDGTLQGSYIKEREDRRERWSLKMNNRSRFPGNININFYSDIASDNEYISDYEIGEVEKLIRDISYGGNLSFDILGFSIYSLLEHRENLKTGFLREKWPSINITFPRINFGSVNIRGNSKYIRDEDKNWGAGVDGGANLGFNLSVFNLNLGFSAMNDYYGKEDVSISHWSGGASIKTRLYGVSLFKVGPISKFRHVLTPSISASYEPEVDSIDVNHLPGFSIPKGRKSLGLSLHNLFQCKIGENKYDFASLSFGTSYQPKSDRFSLVSINGNFWISDYFKQNYSTSYNLYSGEFGDKSIVTDLKYGTSFEGNPVDIILTHRIRFTEFKRIQQADLKLKVNITKKWRVNVNTHYDFEVGRVTSSRIELTRDLHCWELGMSYNTFGERWDYNIRLELKKIPELKFERGTLRTLLP